MERANEEIEQKYLIKPEEIGELKFIEEDLKCFDDEPKNSWTNNYFV